MVVVWAVVRFLLLSLIVITKELEGGGGLADVTAESILRFVGA